MDREGSDQDVIIALLSPHGFVSSKSWPAPHRSSSVPGVRPQGVQEAEPACLGAVLFCTLQRGPFQKRLPSRGFMDRHRTVSLREQQSGLT